MKFIDEKIKSGTGSLPQGGRKNMMLGHSMIDENILTHRSEKLRKRLIETMDQMVNNNRTKEIKINEIEKIMHSVPSVCIEMIYEYQFVKSNVLFIDWSMN